MQNNTGKIAAAGVAATAMTSQFVNLLQQPSMPGANVDLMNAYSTVSNTGEVRGAQIVENEAVMQSSQNQQLAFKQSIAEALAMAATPAEIEMLVHANNKEMNRMRAESMKPLTSAQLEMSSADARRAENQRSVANELANTIATFNQQARAFESKVREQQHMAFLSTVAAIPLMIRAGSMIDERSAKTADGVEAPTSIQTPMQSAMAKPMNPLQQLKASLSPVSDNVNTGLPVTNFAKSASGPTRTEINERLNTVEDFEDLEVVARPISEIPAEPEEIAEADEKILKEKELDSSKLAEKVEELEKKLKTKNKGSK